MARKFFLEEINEETNPSGDITTEPTPKKKKKFFLEPVSGQSTGSSTSPFAPGFLDRFRVPSPIQFLQDTIKPLAEQQPESTTPMSPFGPGARDRLFKEPSPQSDQLPTVNIPVPEKTLTSGTPFGPAIESLIKHQSRQPSQPPVKPIQTFAPNTQLAPSQTAPQRVPSTIQPELTPTPRDQQPRQQSTVDVSKFDPSLVQKVDFIAEQNQIPRDIFRGLVKRESSFNPNVKDGGVGEVGLVQIKPATFREVSSNANIRDVDQNLEGGARYFKKQHATALKRGYAGAEAWMFAASAYNGGPGNLTKAIIKAKQVNDTTLPTFAQVSPHLDKRAVNYAEEISKAFSPSSESINTDAERAKQFGVIRQDDDSGILENIGNTAEIIGKSGTVGANSLLDVIGFGLDALPNVSDDVIPVDERLPSVGSRVRDFAQGNIDSIRKSFTPEQLESVTKSATRDVKDGQGIFGSGVAFNPEFFIDPNAIASKISESLPSTVASIGTGTIFTNALIKTAGLFGIKLGAKGIAVAGGVGFGTAEGTIEGAFTATQVLDAIRNAPQEVIKTSPMYDSFIQQGMNPGQARESMATTLSSRAGFQSGTLAAAFGAPMGAWFARLFKGVGSSNTVSNIFKGALGEAGQETLQSGSSGFIGATAEQEAGLPRDPKKEVVRQGVEGGVVGAFVGPGASIAFQRAGKKKTSGKKFFLEPVPAPSPQTEPRGPTNIDIDVRQLFPVSRKWTIWVKKLRGTFC